MNPVTHGLLGWLLAESAPLTSRDRLLVVAAGLAPDLDGFGYLPDLLTRGSERPLTWFHDWHHVLGHNIAAALAVAALAWAVAHRRWLTGGLALASFHLHLLCDLVGSRGPVSDLHPHGDQWPIPYLSPFSDAWSWTWSGQWPLTSWQNLVITVTALIVTMALARRRGYSPLECLWPRGDRALVGALRQRFPLPASSPESTVPPAR